MKPAYKTLLLSIICMLALGATTASASAHEYKIEGNPLTEAEANGTGSTVKLAWKFAGSEVVIECKSSTVTNELASGGKSKGLYNLDSCTIPAYPHCAVPNISYHFKGFLAGVKGALTEELTLTEGATLQIKNSGEQPCTLKGTFPLGGAYTCALPGIETEATEHEFACKGENVTINGSKATLSYSSTLRLKSGKKWSAS